MTEPAVLVIAGVIPVDLIAQEHIIMYQREVKRLRKKPEYTLTTTGWTVGVSIERTGKDGQQTSYRCG